MTKVLSTQEKHIQLLANAYKKNHGAKTVSSCIIWTSLNKYQDFIPMSDYDKAERIMQIYSPKKHPNGNRHFWYLISYMESHNDAIANLRSTTPWRKIHDYHNFEDWRNYVRDCITKMPGVRELVWYDVALIIAYLSYPNIMPKEKVYVHALPLWAAKKILDYIGGNRQLKRTMNKDFCFPYCCTPTCLSILNAYEMEDFFCKIGHLLKENDNDLRRITPEMI